MNVEKIAPLSKKEVWNDFLKCVKERCSPAAFGNWFSCIKLIDNDSENYDFEVPNIFVQEYLMTNYLSLIREKFPMNDDLTPKFNFFLNEFYKLKKSDEDLEKMIIFREERIKETIYKCFNVGEKYRHACLSQWESDARCQKLLASWFLDQTPFFVFMGNPGTGKTFLCAAVLNHLLHEEKDAYYLSHLSFVHALHKAIDDKKNVTDILHRFSDHEFLIIDDIGSGACSEWQKEVILGLIDKRYCNNLKTLITTNLNEEKMYKDLGYRTASRLMDANNYNIQNWGNDRRKIRY